MTTLFEVHSEPTRGRFENLQTILLTPTWCSAEIREVQATYTHVNTKMNPSTMASTMKMNYEMVHT